MSRAAQPTQLTKSVEEATDALWSELCDQRELGDSGAAPRCWAGDCGSMAALRSPHLCVELS